MKNIIKLQNLGFGEFFYRIIKDFANDRNPNEQQKQKKLKKDFVEKNVNQKLSAKT